MSLYIFLSLFFLIQVQGQGSPRPIDISLNLGILNAERRFWKISILLWSNDLQTLAQTHSNKCNTVLPDFATTSNEYAAITGVPYNPADPLTRVGEVQAERTAGLGITTDYLLVFNNARNRSRDDYNCPADVCRTMQPQECLVYKQAVWKNSQFVGCAISNCSNRSPTPRDVLVCLFSSNGNWNGERTFGANQTSVCDGTYVDQPPQQPASCATINCTSGCQNPDRQENATCDTATGTWVFPAGRNVNVSQLYAIQCPIVINGNLIGSGNLSMTRCANIRATTVSLSAPTRIDLDMAGLAGLGDNFYYGPLLNFTSGGAGPATVNTFGVYSPNQQLCSHLVTSATHTYVRFFACDPSTNLGVPPPLPAGTLPDGTATSTATSSTASTGSPAAPRPNPNNVAPPPGSNNNSGGGGLPLWAIIIIVIVCIIVFILLVVLIIWGIITCMKGKEEERY